jgi:hypothetical protein
LAARNIRAISPNAKVEIITDTVINQKVLARLKNCDVVFSCTDLHAPRSVLNELCYQHFIPLIDVGVGLDSSENHIQAGTIRANIIAPSLPCLFCQNIIRPDVIAEEFMSIEEKQNRKKEGYIRGITLSKTPSMVSFTTIAAGIATTLLIDVLCGFITKQSFNYFIDIISFSINCYSSSIDEECSCSKRLGRGDFASFSAP